MLVVSREHVFRESFTGKVTFAQEPEGGEIVGHEETGWRLGGEDTMRRISPEKGIWLEGFKEQKGGYSS